MENMLYNSAPKEDESEVEDVMPSTPEALPKTIFNTNSVSDPVTKKEIDIPTPLE